MHRCCTVWPWLTGLTGVVPNGFTLSRSAIFTDATPIKPEDSLINIVQNNSLFNVTGKKNKNKKLATTQDYLVSSAVWSALVVLDLFLLGEALELESRGTDW